jgi:hypothetical protein
MSAPLLERIEAKAAFTLSADMYEVGLDGLRSSSVSPPVSIFALTQSNLRIYDHVKNVGRKI